MKMKLKTVRNIILIFVLVIVSGGTGYWMGIRQLTVNTSGHSLGKLINIGPPANREVDFSQFWDVWNRLDKSFIDKSKLVPEQMVYGAISGMVASLGDPYTLFLPPKEQKEAKEELGGSFEGIGAQLGMKDKRVVVVAPLKDMPAEAAGIKAGDWVVKIDGAETYNLSVAEAVNKIRGKGGTSVTLTILHEGDQATKDISIKRGTIIVHSVEWNKTYWQSENGKYVEDKKCTACPAIAYLRLSRFGDQTSNEWTQAVSEIGTELDKGELKGVVLDLRNNPGGYLQGAVFIAGEFLKEGDIVVKQQYNDNKTETYSVIRQGKLLNAPLTVLINKGSASASEIVAGALRDYGRAKLIGEKSFGKGSIQEAQDLVGGSGLHVTIARWLLPKGDWINGKGVDPDIAVALDEKDPLRDTQLQEAANTLLGRS